MPIYLQLFAALFAALAFYLLGMAVGYNKATDRALESLEGMRQRIHELENKRYLSRSVQTMCKKEGAEK